MKRLALTTALIVTMVPMAPASAAIEPDPCISGQIAVHNAHQAYVEAQETRIAALTEQLAKSESRVERLRKRVQQLLAN